MVEGVWHERGQVFVRSSHKKITPRCTRELWDACQQSGEKVPERVKNKDKQSVGNVQVVEVAPFTLLIISDIGGAASFSLESQRDRRLHLVLH